MNSSANELAQQAYEILQSKEGRKKLSKVSIEFYVAYYLRPYLRQYVPIPRVHRRWYRLAKEKARLAKHAPRDHAKSSVFSFGNPLHIICHDRNARGVIISKRTESATPFVRQIRWQLENNVRLIADFGVFKGNGKWTDEQIMVNRSSAAKEPTLQALGRGGQIVSGRYEHVVLDDVEDGESTRLPERRKATQDWFFGEVSPVVVGGGKIQVIGTPWNEDDLICTLSQNPAYYYDIDRAEDENGNPLWPERYPMKYNPSCPVDSAEKALIYCRQCPVYNTPPGETPPMQACLTGRRYEYGLVIYALQFLCNAKALKGQHFKEEWFAGQYYDRELLRWDREYDAWFYGSERLDIYQAVDPAISEDPESDCFAHITIGVTPSKRVLLLEKINVRGMSFPDQVKVCRSQYEKWKSRRVGFEEVAYQSALKQSAELGSWIPAFPIKHSRVSKLERIIGMTTWFESKRIFIAREHTDFKDQLVSYPRGKDDMADAFEMAMFMARLVGKKGFENFGETEDYPMDEPQTADKDLLEQEKAIKAEIERLEKERQKKIKESRRAPTAEELLGGLGRYGLF